MTCNSNPNTETYTQDHANYYVQMILMKQYSNIHKHKVQKHRNIKYVMSYCSIFLNIECTSEKPLKKLNIIV